MLIDSRTETHNTQNNSGNTRTNTEYYSAHDKCFRFSMPFISKQGSQDLFLEPGDYSFPFQIQLPSNLPTSFESSNARIRYSLTSTIDIPWAFDQHTYKAITVISHVDLNLDPTLRRPYNLCESKTVCCCCCKSGPISATLCLKKTGFVCGEYLSGDVTINNQSSRDVKPPTIHLYEKLTLHATTRSKTFVRAICSFNLPKSVPSGTSESFNNIGFVIPAVCPSSLPTSRIINLSYYFDLNFDASGISFSTDMQVPLTIGTIPMREESSNNGPNGQYQLPTSEHFNYKPNFFGPTSDSALPLAQPDKGELIESNSAAYIPQYPYQMTSNPVDTRAVNLEIN